LARAKLGQGTWAEQFVDALQIVAEDAEDEPPAPAIMDYVWFVLLLPWKLLLAFIPPARFLDGWLCFGFSLVAIGAITAVIGDMAGLLGCVAGLPDEITAVTLVALGTSLPDTMASKLAAQQEPHADASIGNVTGSNSVNVFLGLGLPWLMGACFWTGGATSEWTRKYGQASFITENAFEKGAFVVQAGNLAFSVSVFSSFAATAVGVLFLRRKALGGELGGPAIPKYISSFAMVCLWILYVSLSSWYVLTQGSASGG